MNSSRHRCVSPYSCRHDITADGRPQVMACAHKGSKATYAANLMMFSVAAVLFMITMHIAVPIHRGVKGDAQLSSRSITWLVSGSISSCNMQDSTTAVTGQHHAGIANVTAVVDVLCTFSFAQGTASSGVIGSNIFNMQSQQQRSSMPRQIQVAGLDALTCAVAKAVRDNRAGDDHLLSPQQQYVFLLQQHMSGIKHGMPFSEEPKIEIVEYAALQQTASSPQAVSDLVLAKWGQTYGITTQICYDQGEVPTVSSRSSSGVQPPVHPSIVQQRHLLEAKTPESAAEDPKLSSKAVTNSTNKASAEPTAAAPSSAATKGNAPAGSTSKGSGGNKTTAAAGSTKADSTADISEQAPVKATAGPPDTQQQQASIQAPVPQTAQTSKAPGSSNPAVVPRSACLLPTATGSCRASIPQWGYDIKQKQCVEFVWGGCGGNQNRFDSVQSCLSTCLGAEDDVAPSKDAATANASQKGPSTSAVAEPPVVQQQNSQAPAPAPVPAYPVVTSQLPDVAVRNSSVAAQTPAVSSAAQSDYARLAVGNVCLQLVVAGILALLLGW